MEGWRGFIKVQSVTEQKNTVKLKQSFGLLVFEVLCWFVNDFVRLVVQLSGKDTDTHNRNWIL